MLWRLFSSLPEMLVSLEFKELGMIPSMTKSSSADDSSLQLFLHSVISSRLRVALHMPSLPRPFYIYRFPSKMLALWNVPFRIFLWSQQLHLDQRHHLRCQNCCWSLTNHPCYLLPRSLSSWNTFPWHFLIDLNLPLWNLLTVRTFRYVVRHVYCVVF